MVIHHIRDHQRIAAGLFHNFEQHPELTVQARDVNVFGDRTRPDRLPDAYWHIVGTESLSSSDRVTLAADALIDAQTLVVADESDMLKTHHARRTLRATLLARPAWGRLILTGTPVPEGVPDLFAQMRFLAPRILGYRSWYSFAREHIEWDAERRGRIRRVHGDDLLARRIAPYTYQVTREACLDLPPQQWDEWYTALSPEQEAAYEAARWELLDGVPDDELNGTHIYRLFTALQEIASGFWNRRDPASGAFEVHEYEYPHGRAVALLHVVGRIPAGRKVIVWCKFQHSVRQLAALLAPFGGVSEYHGLLGRREREAQLAAWRMPGGPRFLVGTPSTGGRALTLNEASYAVFYERSFSYTQNYQAELRNHRIGTSEPVSYVDVRAECGIEDRLAAAYARKQNVLQAFRREVERVKDKRLVRERLAGLWGG